MSIMACIKCERWVDTDYNIEGVWIDDEGKPSQDNPANLVCSSCCESHFTPEQMEEYENPSEEKKTNSEGGR